METAEADLLTGGLLRAAGLGQRALVDAALEELGWEGALEEDAQAAQLAVAVLFEGLGANNATSSALSRLLLWTALGPGGAPPGPDLGRPGVVLPAFGQGGPPGQRQEGSWRVEGLGLAGLESSGHALVVAGNEAGHGAGPGAGCVAAMVPTAGLQLEPHGGLDPELGLLKVSGTLSPAPVELSVSVSWEDVLAAGRRALGHELVGAGRATLELARQHALERIQFGRPIAAFQAVRHRLADSLVALEAAQALLEAAWVAPSALNAALAKAAAGRGARLVGRHAQQVLAGIGFTSEHPFHRHLRRVLALDGLLGSGAGLSRELGTAVLGSGRLPPSLPL